MMLQKTRGQAVQDRVIEHPFADLAYYRSKIGKLVEAERANLLKNECEEIVGLAPGKWVLSVLSKDPGLDRSLIDLLDLIMDAMALWLKVRNDLDYSARIGGSNGKLPEYILKVLEENLRVGTDIVPKLQDLVDTAVRENDITKAKEISKFKLNIYVNTLQVREFLHRTDHNRVKDEKAETKVEVRIDTEKKEPQKAPKSPLPKKAEKVKRETAKVKAKKAPFPHKGSGKNQPALVTRSAPRQARDVHEVKKRKVSDRFWLALILCAVLVPFFGILYDAVSSGSAEKEYVFMPEVGKQIIDLDNVDTYGTIFYARVTDTWYEMNEERKLNSLERLRSALAKHGFSEGILIGRNKKTLAHWTVKEIVLVNQGQD